jgi:hypothetical protein
MVKANPMLGLNKNQLVVQPDGRQAGGVMGDDQIAYYVMGSSNGLLLGGFAMEGKGFSIAIKDSAMHSETVAGSTTTKTDGAGENQGIALNSAFAMGQNVLSVMLGWYRPTDWSGNTNNDGKETFTPKTATTTVGVSYRANDAITWAVSGQYLAEATTSIDSSGKELTVSKPTIVVSYELGKAIDTDMKSVKPFLGAGADLIASYPEEKSGYALVPFVKGGVEYVMNKNWRVFGGYTYSYVLSRDEHAPSGSKTTTLNTITSEGAFNSGTMKMSQNASGGTMGVSWNHGPLVIDALLTGVLFEEGTSPLFEESTSSPIMQSTVSWNF